VCRDCCYDFGMEFELHYDWESLHIAGGFLAQASGWLAINDRRLPAGGWTSDPLQDHALWLGAGASGIWPIAADRIDARSIFAGQMSMVALAWDNANADVYTHSASWLPASDTKIRVEIARGYLPGETESLANFEIAPEELFSSLCRSGADALQACERAGISPDNAVPVRFLVEWFSDPDTDPNRFGGLDLPSSA
jgi:hypothetical protein